MRPEEVVTRARFERATPSFGDLRQFPGNSRGYSAEVTRGRRGVVKLRILSRNYDPWSNAYRHQESGSEARGSNPRPQLGNQTRDRKLRRYPGYFEELGYGVQSRKTLLVTVLAACCCTPGACALMVRSREVRAGRSTHIEGREGSKHQQRTVMSKIAPSCLGAAVKNLVPSQIVNYI
jgi:hypothetical protein